MNLSAVERKKMGGDFEMIFAVFDEEKNAKSARKIPQIFFSIRRIDS